MMWQGMQIQPSVNAVTVKVWHTVERMPIRKRRRNWRVVRHSTSTPAMYVLHGKIVVCHPSIYDKIKAQCDYR